MEEIKVSVCCITYNHEKFIRKALEGFISQKTTFPFEVLIHDDASTDNTQSIIKEYAEKYPEIIKPILQTENQRAKGISVQKMYNYSRARGKYIALCEGDDYWSDSQKLQVQYDAMEENHDCALCVHQTNMIDEHGMPMERWFPGFDLPGGKITAEKYIHMEIGGEKWLFQTSSFFVKREVIESFLNYQHDYPCGDLPLVLLSLQFGDCWYISRAMSCYRKHSGGILTMNSKSLDASIKYARKMIAGHIKYNEYTNGKYREDFEHVIRSVEMNVLKLTGKYREILNPQYQEILRKSSIRTKAMVYLGAIMPKLMYRVYCFCKYRQR